MIARPRTYVTYCFGIANGAMCCIQCHPQQRWEVEEIGTDVKKYVRLTHKNVFITIPRERIIGRRWMNR